MTNPLLRTALAARTLLAVIAAAGTARAQTGATTLGELARRADAIAVARVLSVRDEGMTCTARLHVQQWPCGGAARTPDLALTEPAGRACGRALHGLAPGASYVVFLVDTPAGPRLATSDARALVLRTPGLIEHVRALRTAADADRAELLAASLAAADARVRADAALDLATAPGVERLSLAARGRILTALDGALGERGTTLPALLTAATRTREPAALDLLVPRYLAGTDPTLDRLLERAVAAFPAEAVVPRIVAAPPGDGSRVVALVRTLAPGVAAPLLLRTATAAEPEPRRAAVRALLDQGASPAVLARLGVAADALRDAVATADDALPRFRSIDPRRAR